MTKKIKFYILYAVILVLAIAYIQSCSSRSREIKEVYDARSRVEFMYKHNESTLKRTITDQNEELVSQNQLVLSKEIENEMLLIENKNLKNIKSEVKIKTITKIKEIYIPFDTIITLIDSISNKKITYKGFNEQTQWYSLSGKVSSLGIKFDSVSFNNELIITLGSKKNGLFKQLIPTVDIINKNPYSSTSEVYNVVIKPSKKRFYEKKSFFCLSGIAIGILMQSKLTR